jgi:elongation factor P
MALNITNLKKGTIFQLDGVPYRVIEYSQKVMGRGGSIVNVKIKSLIDAKVLDKTFKGNEQIDSADVTNKPVQFLYSEAGKFYFMDNEVYEQFSLPAASMENQAGFMKEGDNVTALFFNGQIINIELPKNVPLKVTYTENAVKGDTTTGAYREREKS